MASYSFNNIIKKDEPADKARLENAFAGLPAFDPSTVSVTPVRSVDALELQGLLSKDECGRIVSVCNDLGFTFWADPSAQGDAPTGAKPAATLEADGDGDEDEDADAPEAPPAADSQSRAFRSADTIEVDLPELSRVLWERLKPHMPPHVDFDEAADPDNYERDAEGRWEAAGLNENLLFARYGTGGHFAPHVDGSTIEHFNRRSLYTVLIYLNTVGAGGETTIMTGDQCEVLTKDDASGRIQGVTGKNVVHTLVPVEGACAVFKYNVLHEGTAVAPGRVKYIIRGDVMYRRVPAILDGEKDREAFRLYEASRIEEAEGRLNSAVSMLKRVRTLSPGIADVYQI